MIQRNKINKVIISTNKQKNKPECFQWWLIDHNKSGKIYLVYISPGRDDTGVNCNILNYMKETGNSWDYYDDVKDKHNFIRQVDVTIEVK